MKNYVTLVEKWEEDKYTAKEASTTMQNGGFLTLTGGYALPATPGDPLLGVGQEDVLASDVDFASHRLIAYQTAYNNYFNIRVLQGIILTYGSLTGTFQVGEIVTATTSGATGVVLYDNGTNSMIVQVLSGTFTNGVDTITGGTSGATATTSAAAATVPADQTMVGSPFDLLTPETLDVSGAGSQVEITKFISPSQVEIKVILFA